MGYRIGGLELESRIFLAPMLEPNDIAFRLLCKKAGCALTWTGMTSPLSKQKLILEDKPILQLFGNSARGIRSFMKKYDSSVSGWDFNLGCPSKLSKKLEHGGCLNDVDRIKEIFEVMRDSTEKPVVVKVRKSPDTLKIAKMAEDAGMDAVCIHARTVGQGYGGKVDYDFALRLKKNISVPVIFSGVDDLSKIDDILEDFDFVMIGRKSIGNPGVFGDCDGVGFEDYLKLAKRYGLFFRQIKYQAMNFTKGADGGKCIREKLVEARNVRDIEKIMLRK